MARLVPWLLGLAILLGSPASMAAPPIAQLLQEAETARSSNPQAFQAALDQLNGNSARATPAQREQIAYLNAYAQVWSGHFDESIRQSRALIAATSDIDLTFRTGALIVNSYALSGRYNEGLRQLEQTLSLTDKVKDVQLRQHVLIAAATLYDEIGQYQLARNYAEQVIRAPSTERALCFARYVRFDALLHLSALPQSDAPLLQGIEQCAAQGEAVMANMIRVTLARRWMGQGEGGKAIELLQAHLAEAQATGYQRAIASTRALLAELLFAQGDLAGAEASAKVAAAQRSIVNTPPVVSAYETLYKVAERRRDVAQSLAYYKQYATAQMAYLNDVKARELAYHLVRQESEQKNQQIELLNRQNSVLQLQQKVDQQAAENSRLVMLLVIVVALVIGYWAYKTRRLHVSLRRLAETDGLTGVCNRHHFTQRGTRTLGECARAGEPVALVMFDLDHFKSINDSYGHVTGDWVLVRVAEICRGFCRSIDNLGRLGGEEFALLLHGCDLKAATRVAEDCRVRVAALDSAGSGYSFPISASFGVSANALSGYDLDKLLSHADQAMYRAKREGRNCVRVHERDLPLELPGALPQPPLGSRLGLDIALGS